MIRPGIRWPVLMVNGDDPSRDQMAGPDGAVLRICCKKCGRVYFAPESGCTSVFLWD